MRCVAQTWRGWQLSSKAWEGECWRANTCAVPLVFVNKPDPSEWRRHRIQWHPCANTAVSCAGCTGWYRHPQGYFQLRRWPPRYSASGKSTPGARPSSSIFSWPWSRWAAHALSVRFPACSHPGGWVGRTPAGQTALPELW